MCFFNPMYLFKSAVLEQFASHQGDARKTVFWEPFEELPQDFAAEEIKEFQVEAEKAISECVQPGMAKIARCISVEYLPNCRPDIGVCSLPDGQKFYDQVKKATIKLLFLRRSFLDFFRVHKL